MRAGETIVSGRTLLFRKKVVKPGSKRRLLDDSCYRASAPSVSRGRHADGRWSSYARLLLAENGLGRGASAFAPTAPEGRIMVIHHEELIFFEVVFFVEVGELLGRRMHWVRLLAGATDSEYRRHFSLQGLGEAVVDREGRNLHRELPDVSSVQHGSLKPASREL